MGNKSSSSATAKLGPAVSRAVQKQLGKFDTVFILDDSSSMMIPSPAVKGQPSMSRWAEAMELVRMLAGIAVEHDEDGVELLTLNEDRIYQLNKENASSQLRELASMAPCGGTPTGSRLSEFLNMIDPTVRPLQKPLNIIIITDGRADDDEEVVRVLSSQLQRLSTAMPDGKSAVYFSFFQVGDDSGAAEFLQNLDDQLCKKLGLKDCIDVTHREEGHSLKYLVLKTLIGGIDRDMDTNKELAKIY